MNTQKLAYWLALAVFGLAFRSEYRHGSFPALHRAADRASFTVARLTRCAEHTVAMAKLFTVQPAQATDDLLAAADARELAENQAEMLREQVQNAIELRRDQTHARADMIQALVDVRRAQFKKARSQMASHFVISNAANRRLIVVRSNSCGKTSSRVAVIGSHVSSDGDEDSD